MKLKYPHLPKTLGTIIQENYWSFYPSEPFRMLHFEMRYPVCTYLGKTFSFPVTMIEGGLDTLDKVEAGDVDAEDALEFGVKIGEENTGAAAGTMVWILCL